MPRQAALAISSRLAAGPLSPKTRLAVSSSTARLRAASARGLRGADGAGASLGLIRWGSSGQAYGPCHSGRELPLAKRRDSPYKSGDPLLLPRLRPGGNLFRRR